MIKNSVSLPITVLRAYELDVCLFDSKVTMVSISKQSFLFYYSFGGSKGFLSRFDVLHVHSELCAVVLSAICFVWLFLERRRGLVSIFVRCCMHFRWLFSLKYCIVLACNWVIPVQTDLFVL